MSIPTKNRLIEAIRSRFPPPTYACFSEVGNAVGFSTRRVDVIAMAMWRSRGLEVHGLEIKMSRSDWLRELRDPAKSEELFVYCDRWWIVVPSKGIVKEELPQGWGLLRWNGVGLREEVTAARQKKTKPLTREFVAAVLRHAHKTSFTDIRTVKRAEEQRIRAEAHKAGAESVEWDRSKYESLKLAVQRYEEKSGVSINHWDSGKVGEAVRALLGNNGRDRVVNALEAARRILAYHLQGVTDQIERVKAEGQAASAHTPKREQLFR